MLRSAALLALSLPLLTVADSRPLLHRSNIILQRPNRLDGEAMPLGNGSLGLAIWAGNGLTLQLNRADTLPKRLSPGQVLIPGLEKMNAAHDYRGELNLETGEFSASGGGIRMRVYVETEADVAVVEVHGLSPKQSQSALLRLWSPRMPQAAATNGMALLAETWKDNRVPGATGQTFGSLAALRVEAQDVSARVDGALGVSLTFRPRQDGSFRLKIAAPHWAGGDAPGTAEQEIRKGAGLSAEAHRLWWRKYWAEAADMKMNSPNGEAEYFENLRAIYLYLAAAERGTTMPGSQAGVAALFSPFRDIRQWDPAAFWHFNLRMLVAANLGAGLPAENDSYFRLYRDNLPRIEDWTRKHMDGRAGSCVPETMRFNGAGYENEDWVPKPGLNCDAESTPYYNARTLSTGAEIAGWIWRQYLMTDDRQFLSDNYPVMASAARFLLDYSKVGKDKLRHTQPTNAHENQWDVRDSTNDICAMQTLFPAVAEAARILGRDAALVKELRQAIPQVPDLPLQTVDGEQVIAPSYMPDAPIHNTENVGLEPIWPYGLIGDTGPAHELGVRSFEKRTNKMQNDWSFDPVQAARVGLRNEVRSTLLGLTERYQTAPSGLASFIGAELYVEQSGNVALALQEALLQDYDGVIRIAPAWPEAWDVTATLPVQHRGRMSVEVHGGSIGPATLHSGSTGTIRIRNPWPGQKVSVQQSGKPVSFEEREGTLQFAVKSGEAYRLTASSNAVETVPSTQFETGPRRLGSRTIGLFSARP